MRKVLAFSLLLFLACGSKPSVDIVGVWESVEKVKTKAGFMTLSMNFTPDTFESVPGTAGPLPYVIIEEKKGEMELALHFPGNKERRVFVQRKGDRLWLRQKGVDGESKEFKYAMGSMSEGQMVRVRKSSNRIMNAGEREVTRTALKIVRNNLEFYYQVYGQYPKVLNDLTKGRSRLKPKALIDPWKRPFNYSLEDRGFTLCSDGPDGKRGTKDDICL